MVRVIVAVAYPLVVWYGLTHLSVRWTAAIVLGMTMCIWIAPVLLSRPSVVRMVPVPEVFGIVALVGVSLSLGDKRFLLLSPVLINVLLLTAFARSLRTVPMAERFARMSVADLSAEEVRYCRRVTMTWCVFFVLNGGTAAALAYCAPIPWWALYTGVLSYVAMGALMGVEYVLRKALFRRYGSGVHDKWLAYLFPPRH